MKKTDHSRRPQRTGGNGTNSGGRQNGRPNKPAGNSPNRSQPRRHSGPSAQAWLASSQPLSSHISAGEKSRQANSKKQKNRSGNGNGNGQSASFHKGRENGHRNEKSRYPNRPRRDFDQNNNRGSVVAKPEVTKTGDTTQGKGDLVSGIDPFELFCAYHLGIEPNNGYKQVNINQASQRFGVSPAAIRQATQKYGFDSEAMLNKDFDLALAQLDIQVAPEGVSKVELAKGIYEEFLNAPVLKRDWGKILQEDAKENQKVFGG